MLTAGISANWFPSSHKSFKLTRQPIVSGCVGGRNVGIERDKEPGKVEEEEKTKQKDINKRLSSSLVFFV